MWFVHPRREQIWTTPPPRSANGTIGALHTGHFQGQASWVLQCGQK